MIKLPENPDDRKKILVLIVMGTLGLLYLLVTFGLLPYRQSLLEKRARISEFEDKIWRAKKDLETMERAAEQNRIVVAKVLKASEQDRHILRPSLGNYLLVATEQINRSAAGLDIDIDTINELPRAVQATPKKGRKEKPPTNRFSPYTINLSLTCGLHDLARFLYRLESENPYLTLTRLIVLSQKEQTPERHFVSLHIQWPIWVDADHPQRLQAEQIADEERQ